jgi:small multidrug resistance family-3 protein
MLYSLGLFALAGLCEIGGGYLVWLWLREGKTSLWGVLGAAILILYGIVPTWQAEPAFGRVYAAYGGVFVVLAMLWGWGIDRQPPDLYDMIGACLCLIGVAVIMWSPRS